MFKFSSPNFSIKVFSSENKLTPKPNLFPSIFAPNEARVVGKKSKVENNLFFSFSGSILELINVL